MNEKTERGLLTDIAIFVVIVALALLAIYMTGNWPWFLKMVANLEAEARNFANMFVSNIQILTDTVKSTPNPGI